MSNNQRPQIDMTHRIQRILYKEKLTYTQYTKKKKKKKGFQKKKKERDYLERSETQNFQQQPQM